MSAEKETSVAVGRMGRERKISLAGHHLDRFLKHVMPEPNSGCWIWTSEINKKGYGVFGLSIAGKEHSALAHRVYYQHVRGPIPQGTVLDHLCRVRCCVNPDHLEGATHRINILRGIGPAADNARKTHCKRGHPFSGDNLYVNPEGERVCQECNRQRHRRQIFRKREKRAAEPLQGAYAPPTTTGETQ